MSAVVVTGLLKDYDWGIPRGLSAWHSAASSGPEAELWFGTHPSGRSPIKHQFGSEPVTSEVLVKLLAAHSPLSIQVHPGLDAMKWMHEHGQGHLLSDDQIKSELLIAIESFDVLVGLRQMESAKSILSAMGPEHHSAGAYLDEQDWHGLFAWLLTQAPPADCSAALDALTNPDERRIMQRVLVKYPDDRGLAVAFLMQPYALVPGQAMFTDVGTIHSYVGGTGLEVMISSDNVLRLGLTQKNVAVGAALVALDPQGAGRFLVASADGWYRHEHMGFAVQRISGTVQLPSRSTLLCLAGEVILDGPLGTATLSQGQAALIGSQAGWKATTEAVAWLATPNLE